MREVMAYLGPDQLNYALVNDNPAAASAIRDEWQVEAILYDGAPTIDDSVEIIARDVVNDSNPLRHDPAKLSNVLLEIARRAAAERVAARAARGEVLVEHPVPASPGGHRYSA